MLCEISPFIWVKNGYSLLEYFLTFITRMISKSALYELTAPGINFLEKL